jgi:hypothetical protein
MKAINNVLVFLLLCINSVALFSQNNVAINILDEHEEMISYAYVVLYDTNDNIMTGAISTNGIILFDNISQENYKLCITYFGYKDTCISINHNEIKDMKFTIHLLPDVKILSELSITASKPTITVNRDNNISINIENTQLKDVENFEDILKYIPGVVVTSEGVRVFGSSVPMFMINGKEVFSHQEIEVLKPEDIQTIELITSNAIMDASKKYAINIITVKRKKFFGVQIYNRLTHNRALANEAHLYLSFNTKKVQQSLVIKNDFGKYKQTETSSNQVFFNVNDIYKTSIEMKSTGKNNFNNLYYGINYDIDTNQYIGIQLYGYLNQPEYSTDSKSIISDSIVYFSKTKQTENSFCFQASANYSYQMPNAGQLLFVGDYYIQNSKGKMNIAENQKNYIIDSDNKYMIYSIGGAYNFPITKIKTNASFGFKLYRTDNKNISMTNMIFADDIFNKKNNLTEQSVATYCQFNTLIKKITISGGIRFEYYYKKIEDFLQITDSLNLIKKPDFFPNLSIRYNISDANVIILHYSRNINRQAYNHISGENYYLNPYLYRIGNINLKPEIINSLSLSYIFRELLQIQLGYSNSKNYTNLGFSSNDSIIIAKYENFDKQDLNLGIIFSMERSRHYTSITLNFAKSFIDFPNSIGTLKFPKINFNIFFNNILNITKDFSSDVSFAYHPKMQYDYILLEPEFNISLGLRYFFLNKTLRLGIYYDYNSMNKYTQQYKNTQIYHLIANRKHVFYFTILYKFNFNQKWVIQENSIEEEKQRIE